MKSASAAGILACLLFIINISCQSLDRRPPPRPRRLSCMAHSHDTLVIVLVVDDVFVVTVAVAIAIAVPAHLPCFKLLFICPSPVSSQSRAFVRKLRATYT